MAAGTSANLVLRDSEFRSAFVEVITREANAFNQASRGALVLDSQSLLGDYNKTSYWANGTFVKDRDPTSLAASVADPLTQAETIGVKKHIRAHIENTQSSFRQIGETPEIMSRVLGEMIGKEYLVKILDDMISACSASIDLEVDADTGTLETADFTSALRLFGDGSNQLVAVVMHSNQFFNLVGNQITAHNQYELAYNMVVHGALPGTFGRPVIVTDSASLVSVGTGPAAEDEYHTLLLAPGGAKATESEDQTLLFEAVGGGVNVMQRFQWEAAYNLEIRGQAWDIANGGANPNAAAIASAGNWDQVSTSAQGTAGVRIVNV